MAGLSNAGFNKINLITETGGPSTGAAPREAQPEGSADLRPAQ
jgi:biopolymer transport protein TolR